MVINSRKSAVIVISSEATPRERFAARELCDYLEKIVGVRLAIVDGGSAVDQQIILGGPARNMAARAVMSVEEFNAVVTGDEGFLIRSFGEDKLLLAGSEGSAERGTVYAVYEFLER